VTDRHERADQSLLPHRLTSGQYVLTEDREEQRPSGRSAYRSSAELVVHAGLGSGTPSNSSRIASKYVLQVRQRAWQVMI
jgi:hypothetical protein